MTNHESPHNESLPDAQSQLGPPTELPESAARRLLELRLLYHFISTTAPTFPATQDPETLKVWTVLVPGRAVKNVALLYALLSMSSLHLSKTETHDDQLRQAHRTYLGLSIMHHRHAVAAFERVNFDSLCFTSVLLVLGSLATLQDRPLEEPYAPPVDCLHMGAGVRDIFRVLWENFDGNSEDTMAARGIMSSGSLASDLSVIFAPGNRARYDHILQPVTQAAIPETNVTSSYGMKTRSQTSTDIPQPDMDLADPEILEAYHKTLSFIGSVAAAIERNEHPLTICRWLMVITIMMPAVMTTLIEQKQPRALVILAQYFKLAEGLTDIWWVGNVAQREVTAIKNWLPPEWSSMIDRRSA